MNKQLCIFNAGLFSVLLLLGSASAQVPNLVNYQGRIAVGNPAVNFDGTGQFKFALVDAAGTTTYWSNDGTSVNGSQPTNPVSLVVTKGLYSVLLGDTSLGANMTAIPASVWNNADVRLRVWFNNGVNGSQLLTPDQRIAPGGYLADGAVGTGALAAGAVTTGKIANGAIGSAQLGTNAVSTANIAPGAVGTGQIATGAVGTTQLTVGALPSVQIISGTTQLAQPNSSYAATSTAPVSLTLPSSANLGDVVQLSGLGAGGWAVGLGWSARESARVWQAAASSADGKMLVAAEGVNSSGPEPVGPGGQIYTSTDSGVTWTAREEVRAWSALASSANGVKLAAASGGTYNSGPLLTSIDAGVTWTSRETSRKWTGVASSADGTKLSAVALNAQIYVSNDSGVTWTARESNRSWRAIASSADGSRLVAAVYFGQLYTSSDSGTTWIARDEQRTWQTVASSADGSRLIAADQGTLYLSSDFGVTWAATSENGPFGDWKSVASSADGKRLLAVGKNTRVYRSVDFGANWTALDNSRRWTASASSADGATLLVGAFYDNLYLEQVIFGAQNSTVAVQHTGAGIWTPIQQSAVAAGVVGSAQLASNAVQSSNIATGAVGNAQLANNAVQTAHIAAAAVGNTQLADSAVQTSNIAAAAVGNMQLASNAVQTANIADGTVTNAKLALSSITLNTVGGLAGGGQLSLGGSLSLSTNATSANTANAIISRAADGSFSAGPMTTTGTAQSMINASSNNTLGTWLRLGNTSSFGQQWNLISTGTNSSEGPGKLIFQRADVGLVMTLSLNGMGLGTITPQRLLQVGDGGNAAGSEGMIRFGSHSATTSAARTWEIGVPKNDNDGTAQFYSFVIDDIAVGTTPEFMVQYGTGNVGIGTVAPTHLLHVNGVARSTQANWATSSDARVKDNIHELSGSLEKLEALRPVTFEYTSAYRKEHKASDGLFTGFIAQEVEKVFPEMVTTVPEKVGEETLTDFHLLNTSGLLPHVVAGIKALKAENEALRKRADDLEQRLEKLETGTPTTGREPSSTGTKQ